MVWGRFEFGSGSVWGRFGIVLGSAWGRFGIVLGSFWNRFGIVLGSFWVRYGVNLVIQKVIISEVNPVTAIKQNNSINNCSCTVIFLALQ